MAARQQEAKREAGAIANSAKGEPQAGQYGPCWICRQPKAIADPRILRATSACCQLGGVALWLIAHCLRGAPIACARARATAGAHGCLEGSFAIAHRVNEGSPSPLELGVLFGDLNHRDLGAGVGHRAGHPIVAKTKGVHLAILGSLHSQAREHLGFGAAGSLRLGNRLEDVVRHALNFNRHGPLTHEPLGCSPTRCGERDAALAPRTSRWGKILLMMGRRPRGGDAEAARHRRSRPLEIMSHAA
jgi:hypothetical protein